MKDSKQKAGKNGNRVAVAVPLSMRHEFTDDEEISLRHLTHFLGGYDRYFVSPRSGGVVRPGFGVRRFHDAYFGSVASNTRLMLSPKFYESFRDYEYILIYHLDSLVFSDRLLEWCDESFDYIGAPWVKYEGAPYCGMAGIEDLVGNGGFSLRKVESCLKVLSSTKYSEEPSMYWQEIRASHRWHGCLVRFPKMVIKYLRRFNNVGCETSSYGRNEDHFWANRAQHYYPEFRTAPLEKALSFAFECGPRICFEKNGHKLPFGCHAWHRYDRQFWEPYLLKAGQGGAAKKQVNNC